MAKKTLVIEINERTIRLAEMSGAGREAAVGGSATLLTPRGLVTDGQINDPESLAELIKAALSENSLTAKSVVFIIASGRIAAREVTVPFVKDNRLKAIIDTNASEYFPVDLSGYHLSHSTLGTVETEEGKNLRVMVYATPLPLAEGYFRLASAAGLAVQSIDYIGNSLFSAVRGTSGESSAMYVCVDSGATYISFQQGEDLLLRRNLTFGGDELVLDYLRVTDRDTDAYLDALSELLAPDFTPSGAISEAAIAESLERLVSGINRSLGYFNANNHENPVEHIVLYGQCGNLPQLKALTETACSLPVFYLEELPETAKRLPGLAKGSEFIGCIGACISPLGIMPPQFAAQKKKKRSGSAMQDSIVPGIACISAFAVLSAALFGFAFMGNSGAKKEKAAIEQEIERLKYAEDTYNEYQTYLTSLGSFVALRESNETPMDDLVPFFQELEHKMPTGIAFVTATCTQADITLSVTVPELKDVATVMVQLRTFVSISNPVVSSIMESADETGNGYISFTVTCEYGENPYGAVEFEVVEPVEPETPPETETDGAGENQEGEVG